MSFASAFNSTLLNPPARSRTTGSSQNLATMFSRRTCTCGGSLRSGDTKKNRYGSTLRTVGMLARRHSIRLACLGPPGLTFDAGKFSPEPLPAVKQGDCAMTTGSITDGARGQPSVSYVVPLSSPQALDLQLGLRSMGEKLANITF